MVYSFQNFDVQNNETPKLKYLAVHPEFIFFCDFHHILLFGDNFPAR
mgnify:CR=1 FL=1|jgi:hypothetical protein